MVWLDGKTTPARIIATDRQDSTYKVVLLYGESLPAGEGVGHASLDGKHTCPGHHLINKPRTIKVWTFVWVSEYSEKVINRSCLTEAMAQQTREIYGRRKYFREFFNEAPLP